MDEEQKRFAEEVLFAEEPKPSFVKLLYKGEFDSERVFPYPYPSKQHREEVSHFVNTVNQFCEEKIDADWIDRNMSIPDSVISGLAELGVLGATATSEFGGKELTQFGFCKPVETIARYCGSTALFVNVQHSIGVRALLVFGTDEQKQRFLPKMIKGECLSSFALTEPNAGSDASGVETRAVFDEAKNVWRINGRKQWITNGSLASILTVMAKTTIDTPEGPRDKVTAFIVQPDMPGFEIVEPRLEKLGMRGSTTTNFKLTDVEVPPENILGEVGSGLRVALTTLDFGRTTFGATCTGVGKECLERAMKHAKSRYQFKRPLASFPLVKEKIANMHALTYAMDAATYLSAGILDRGEEDFMLETAIIKVFNSDAVWQILYDTMQIYGGRSFFTDQPFERMMRDARLNMIGEGSNEVLRAFIGLVGLRDMGMELKAVSETLSSPTQGLAALWSVGKRGVMRVVSPKVPVQCRELTEEAAQLAKAVQRFGKSCMSMLVKHKEDIMERQLILNRIADSVMAIYTTTAVISKLDTDISEAGSITESLRQDLDVGKYYCKMAFKTIDRALDEMVHNDDENTERLADKLSGVCVQ